MRYIVNSDNHVVAISFGSDIVYADCECTEYKGNIPSGYSSLEKWYLEEELTLWRWKIIDGNLTLDPTATAPEEGQWGVPDLQSKTVSPKTTKQTVIPDEGFDGLSQVIVNAMSSGALSSPNISVSSGGVITATSKVGTSGYLSSGASKQNTYSMSTASGNTITPGISQKTAVPKGRYTTGDVMVAGDTNLIASNIKSGVDIFGVVGTYGGEWTYETDVANYSRYDTSEIIFSGITKANPAVLLVFSDYMFESDEDYSRMYVMQMMYSRDFYVVNDEQHWGVFATTNISDGYSDILIAGYNDSAYTLSIGESGLAISMDSKINMKFMGQVNYRAIAFYNS